MATDWFSGTSSKGSSWFTGGGGSSNVRTRLKKQQDDMEKFAKEEEIKKALEDAKKEKTKKPDRSWFSGALHTVGDVGSDVGHAAFSAGRAVARPVIDVATGQGGKAVHDTAQLSSDVFGGGVNTFARGIKNVPKAIAGEIASASSNPYTRAEGIKSVKQAQRDTFGEKDFKKGEGAMAKNLIGALASVETAVGGGVIAKGASGLYRSARGAKALEGAATARASRLAGVGEKAGKQALRGSQRITDSNRLLGTGSERFTNRIKELEKEKQALIKSPTEEVTKPKTLETAGTKTELLAGVKFAKNREAGLPRVTKGITREVGNETQIISKADRLRQIQREQKSLQAQLEAHNKPTTSIAPETKPTVVNPKNAPKAPVVEDLTPHTSIPTTDFADTKRAKLTNWIISTTGNLSRHGKEGQKLADLVHEYNHTARDLATNWYNRVPTLTKLKRGESDNFAQAVQGLADPKNARVAKAVKEWKDISPEIRQAFITHSGEDVGNVENYFPRAIKPEFLKQNSKGWNAAVKHLVETGQVKDRGEAVRQLSFARKAGAKGNVLGSFKFHRNFDLPTNMYDTSGTAIANYLEGAAHSVSGAKVLGMDKGGSFHTADSLIGDIASRGGNAENVKKTFEQAMGLTQHNETAVKLSNAARSFNILTKLGLGAITNVGQTSNTAIRNGFIDTAKALGYLTTKGGRQYARETGAFTHGLINDLREATGITGKSGKIGAPGFQSVEKFNRLLAASAGKFHAERLAKRASGKGLGRVPGYAGRAEKGLAKEGLTKNLTKEQLRKAGRTSSDITQFEVAPHTLPGWASSPAGKVVAQFQTFSYKQADFVANEILKPLAKGNAAPLARLIAVLPAGYGIYNFKSKLRGNNVEGDTAVAKILNAWRAVGGGGTPENIVSNVLNADKYSKSGPEYAANLAKNTLGPTVGTTLDTVNSAYSAAHGNTKPAQKQGLKMVPVAGPTLANKYIPSGSDTSLHIKDESPTVSKELNKIGYRIQDTSNKTGRAAELSSKDYRRYSEVSSRIFSIRAQKALNSDEYKAMSDENKKKQLSAILRGAREDVMDQLVGKPERNKTAQFSAYR